MTGFRVVSFAVVALAAAGCDMPGDGMDEMPGDGMDGMNGMNGMAMGDRAEITVVAEAELAALPAEPLAWIGYEAHIEDDRAVAHAHGPAFVYADEEPHGLVADGRQVELDPGEAVFVGEGVQHTHEPGSFWEIMLDTPDADPPDDLEGATVAFSSGALGGIPEPPVRLRFLVVDLPARDGQTAVHTHPGPEYIVVRDGVIEYEASPVEATELTAGDDGALPPDTAVQKRNRSDAQASFWSWFIVDPDEPFSSEAEFSR